MTAFILPDSNARSEGEMKELIAAINKSMFSDVKKKALSENVTRLNTKYFSSEQTVKILKQFTFSGDMADAVAIMSDYIIQMTCKDVATIVKDIAFSADKLKVLELLKDLISDANDANKKRIIETAFTFSSDKAEAKRILDSIKPRNNPLYGRVVYNPVVFVIDISGSMSTTFKASDGQTRSRLNVAVEELINVLKEQMSPERSKFNIIMYSDRMIVFYPEPVLATDQNKQDAITRLRQVQAGGGTNTYGALTKALATKDLNGVYLLSDGDPTDARPDAIVAATKGYKIPITTIGFFLPEKNPNARSFMEKLAVETGGLFRAIE